MNNLSQTDTTSLKIHITELSSEIKSVRDKLSSMQADFSNKFITFENMLKPILQVVPELISFVRKNSNNNIEKDPPFNLPTLPFTCTVEVEAFNLKLIDTSYSNQMVLFLKSEVERRKINKNIRNILEKLIDTETLNNFTWTGAINIKKEKIKKAFGDLSNLANLIENTINYRFNELGFSEISKTDFRKSFVDVLKRVAERYRYAHKLNDNNK